MAFNRYTDLTRGEQKMFQTESRHMFLSDIDCDTAFGALAALNARLNERAAVVCASDMFLFADQMLLERRVNRFIPVAHAVLTQELEELLEGPRRQNNDRDL